MSDPKWTQKFDRWWEKYHVTIPSWEHRVRGLAMVAFLAGAAAERAEHRCDRQILPPDDDKYDEELFG